MLRERMVAFTKNMNTTMQTNEETFCVSVGFAITHATGKKKMHNNMIAFSTTNKLHIK